ncbi:MAG: hypothetical protein RLZ98_2971 [Pseudomonadota bacterium]|jgi:phthalate 4,5-cis-dihydrodiol dehydrogenase
MNDAPINLGVIGLGRAFTLMLPTLMQDPRIRLVAATDPRSEACRQFVQDFAARSYDSAEGVCGDADVEAVYIASPHQLHAEHAQIAARSGRHVLVEKPMAISIAECLAMVETAEKAGTHVIVGHSHSFDAPIIKTHDIIASGAHGRLGMINALQFTDFMYRPRRPEELVTADGGGVIFSQGAHQIDIVRLLAGGMARSVRAGTGIWDPTRPAEGAYSAHLTFENGVFASLTYSGFAHFDSDELMEWIGEGGQRKDPTAYWTARQTLANAATAAEEAALKASRNYGGAGYSVQKSADQGRATLNQHFGFLIASCANADLRPMADRVIVYSDKNKSVVPVPPSTVPRKEVVDELWSVVREGKAPLHSGRWGLATLEVCLAIIRSANEGRELRLDHQIAVPEGGH